MQSDLPTQVFVGLLEYFYDDYKRSEGYSELVGVFSSKTKAYQATLSKELLKNADYEEYDEDEDEAEGVKKVKKIPYLLLSTENQFDKEFLEKWEFERESFLGEPQFGNMRSSGYRFRVDEVTMDK